MAVFSSGVKEKRKNSRYKVMTIANCITLILMLALAFALLLAAAPVSDYAGAATCSKCHSAEFATQTASAHARALSRSTPQQPGEWAFGAGEQAITFVSRVDPEHYREQGKSWYRKLN